MKLRVTHVRQCVTGLSYESNEWYVHYRSIDCMKVFCLDFIQLSEQRKKFRSLFYSYSPQKMVKTIKNIYRASLCVRYISFSRYFRMYLLKNPYGRIRFSQKMLKIVAIVSTVMPVIISIMFKMIAGPNRTGQHCK